MLAFFNGKLVGNKNVTKSHESSWILMGHEPDEIPVQWTIFGGGDMIKSLY